MLKFILCILIGYLLGSLSPAAFFAKIKKQNLREQGSGNLGATNTFLIIGKVSLLWQECCLPLIRILSLFCY